MLKNSLSLAAPSCECLMLIAPSSSISDSSGEVEVDNISVSRSGTEGDDDIVIGSRSSM